MMPACPENQVRRFGRRVSRTILAAMLSAAAATASALPVIPGAYGFGIDTPAGRGGTVYRVTNLNASGSGSLDACARAASGPRVCIFEVSGVIQLAADMIIRNPYLTIAGQTAPSPGIMIRGAALIVATSNVLIQHITIRVGDDSVGSTASDRDAFKVDSPYTASSNIVVDHCTFSWGLDETVSIWSNWDNVTFSNNIVSEGLHYSVMKDFGGYGSVTRGVSGQGRLSMTGNLFAHNLARNPLTNANSFVFVNNVVYNMGAQPTTIQSQHVATKNSIVGNLYIRGPDTGKPYNNGDYIAIHDLASYSRQVYLQDNARLTAFNSPQVPQTNQWANVYYHSGQSESAVRVNSPPVWVPGLVAKPVGDVRASVLAQAGARPGDRSAKDREMIQDVLNGTGNIVNCVSSNSCRAAPYNKNAGGWPVYAQNTRPLTLPSNPSGDSDGDGYTNLEDWLHDMANQVEGKDTSIPNPPTSVAVQ